MITMFMISYENDGMLSTVDLISTHFFDCHMKILSIKNVISRDPIYLID